MKISLRNLKEFKTTFQEYKVRLPSYYKEDKTPKTWEFQVNMVHTRILYFKAEREQLLTLCR